MNNFLRRGWCDDDDDDDDADDDGRDQQSSGDTSKLRPDSTWIYFLTNDKVDTRSGSNRGVGGRATTPSGHKSPYASPFPSHTLARGRRESEGGGGRSRPSKNFTHSLGHSLLIRQYQHHRYANQ